MPMTAPRPRCRQPENLDAGIFRAEINSFARRLAAGGKAAKTTRTCTEAVRWFAATGLPGRPVRGGREQVTSGGIQRWMAWLPGRCSAAYASSQYRAVQRFFKRARRRGPAARPGGRAGAAARPGHARPGLHPRAARTGLRPGHDRLAGMGAGDGRIPAAWPSPPTPNSAGATRTARSSRCARQSQPLAVTLNASTQT
jgi:hypothetical protein